MFTNEQIEYALTSFGVSADTHTARLIALDDMRNVDGATLESISVALKYATACDALAIDRNDNSAKAIVAAERIEGFSVSTFARYAVVLDMLKVACAENETVGDLLAADVFLSEALSALVQLATGKCGPRKSVTEALGDAIAKRDSARVIKAYRRLLAASKAKAKAKATRDAKAKSSAVTVTTEPANDNSPGELSPVDAAKSLSVFELVEILSARIASEELTSKQTETLSDALAGISAMLDA